MAKGTRGGSGSPIVIVMLLVAAVALALYFGRDIVSPEGPPASGTESAEQADTGATPSDPAASADTSGDESESFAEQVAGKIVERLEEGSEPETQTGGESLSAPTETAKSATAAPSASTGDAAPEDQVQADAATGSEDAAGDAPEDEIQASGETAMTGAGGETEPVAEGQIAADATTLPAEDADDGAGTLTQATGTDDTASASTADSSAATVDSAADDAPEDQAQAGAATGTQGATGDALDDEMQAGGETETAMTGAGGETESVAEGQVAANATTISAEGSEDSAATLPQATDTDETAPVSTADSSAATLDSAADDAPEDQVQAGAATGTQGATGDALEDEMQAGGESETAMSGAGEGTESVAEDQVAADAATLPAEGIDDADGTVAMVTDDDDASTTSTADSSTASVDSAADSASDDQMQAGTETAGTTSAAAPEDETPQAGAGTAKSSSSGTLASVGTAQPDSGGTADTGGQQEESTDPSAVASSDPPSEEEQLQMAEEVATRVADAISDLRPSPAPGTVAKAAAEVAEELGLDVATLAQAVAEAVVEEQAESFVEQIAEADPQPLEVDDADHFVSPDQMVSLLPDASFEITSRKEILSDPELGPDTPITVVREVEEIRIANPEKLIASAGGDLDREIRVLEDDELRVKTLNEVLAELMESPAEAITIISDVQYFEVTTPSEFARQSQIDDDEPLKIIKDRYTLEAASVAELLRHELDLPSDAIFYLRTVRPEDVQGIWGIVQEGLSGNFARGMAIRYGQSINTYRVEIPRHADEILPDNSSSFLGKLIHEKTLESYVYNFKHHRIGRNPDRIYPGQEIVIINFTPGELISIFKHFVEQRTASG